MAEGTETPNEALLKAALMLAEKSAKSNAPSAAVSYADAARSVAEAYAWLNNPAQSH